MRPPAQHPDPWSAEDDIHWRWIVVDDGGKVGICPVFELKAVSEEEMRRHSLLDLALYA